VAGVAGDATLTITATGGVAQDPAYPLVGPDGNHDIIYHFGGAENGISDITVAYDTLLGVFLDNQQPNVTPPPGPATDYSRPGLKQVFRIGSKAIVTVPPGATRLFLGTMDAIQWINNIGSFAVTIQGGGITVTPHSQVSQLPALEPTANFLVQWSGTDSSGPGIQDYSIYVSDNGAPFTAWLTQTTATQATFTGVSGRAYAFYSIAQDSAGNLETPKSQADTATYVDAVKPVSHVLSLPVTEPTPSFSVQWSGTDTGGPGIRNYSVYVSDNSGPFSAWLIQTTSTQATFNGASGHTYGFYTIAQDSYGIAENSKSAAEATTTAQGSLPKPISHVSTLPGAEPSPNFQVQWSGTDTGGPGIRNYNIYVSDNGGAFTLWQSNTTATQAWYAGYLGHTYGFFSQATDTAGTQETLKSAAEATTQTPASSPMDVNHDGLINCTDLNTVKAALGITKGQPGWNQAADINSDGVIDVRDLAAVSQMLIPNTNCSTTAVPISHVSPLPAYETTLSFPVQWSGTDTAYAIRNFTIYVSDNGAAFTAWLIQTTTTQASFTGVSGHTYGFYSIAHDTGGNIEGPKSAAETITYLDATKPVSHVSSLPPTETSPTFLVQWSGTDVSGPGIASYTIYVSDNGAAFTAWLTQTTVTQATFNGGTGHTYGFYTIAYDIYGNAENSKSVAEATTLVQTPKPVSHVSSPASPPSSNFQVQWSGTDTGGPGIRNYNIYVSDNGGPFTLWLSNSATQAWYAGYLGHTYGFFSQANDTAGNQENLKSSTDATTQTPASSPKDVNHDGMINCTDLGIVKAALGSTPGQLKWNPAADINNDGVIDVRDLAAVSQMLIPGTTCN